MNELFLKLYNNYKEQREIVESLIKDHKIRLRKPNFPEHLSEYVVKNIIKGSFKGKTGDLCLKRGGKVLKIEIKCFSSTGPSSFGPKEGWDIIVFVDAVKHPTITVYISETSNTDVCWKNLKVSKGQTFEDQCLENRRPRLPFSEIRKSIKFREEKYNIIDILKKKEVIYKMSEEKKSIPKIRIADFFAGVGGIRKAFEDVKTPYGDVFETVFSNEIDSNAIKTYESNWSGKVCSTSISDLKVEDIPDFDLFLGGFPCQPFSIAGKLKGFEDARGNVFFDIIRILRAKKPLGFMLENVKNLKTHDSCKTYQRIKKELCSLGYTFQSKVLNTKDYGNIPQNRERIFFVGFLDRAVTESFRFPEKIPLTKTIMDVLDYDVPDKYYYTESSSIYPMLVESVVNKDTVYQYRRKYVRENKNGVCPTLTCNMGSGGHNVPIIVDGVGIRKLTPKECFKFQGFENIKLPNLADSHLYKQAGNSVSIPVVRRIAENMEQAIFKDCFSKIVVEE
jgi:DNA (cytosine-5)-methyltransferase 1